MTFELTTLGKVVDELTVGHVGSMASEYVTTGIPFLRSLNIEPYRISVQDIRYIDPAFHAKLRKSALKPGDVVIVRTGKPGTCAVVPEWLTDANCSDLVIARTGSKLHPRYLAYWVNSMASQHISGHLVGAVQQHFNVGAARELPILVPSFHEQLKILEVLGALDDKIELNRRMNETLEAMAQAIFRDWFVDFGPTRRKLDGATDPLTIMGGLVQDAERAQALADLFPAALGDDGLPEGWREEAIGDLMEIIGGSTPSTGVPDFWEDGVHPWATPKDLSKLDGMFLAETERCVTDAGLAKIGSGLSPIGTVLLSSRAPIGYLAVAAVPVAVNQGFIALRPSPRMGTAQVLFWCRENMDVIKAHANGSTFMEISKKNFRPLPVVMGSDQVSRTFDEVVSPFLALINSKSLENRTLAATRDLLLPKLMSGEIRLSETEDLMVAAQ